MKVDWLIVFKVDTGSYDSSGVYFKYNRKIRSLQNI